VSADALEDGAHGLVVMLYGRSDKTGVRYYALTCTCRENGHHWATTFAVTDTEMEYAQGFDPREHLCAQAMRTAKKSSATCRHAREAP